MMQVETWIHMDGKVTSSKWSNLQVTIYRPRMHVDFVWLGRQDSQQGRLKNYFQLREKQSHVHESREGLFLSDMKAKKLSFSVKTTDNVWWRAYHFPPLQ